MESSSKERVLKGAGVSSGVALGKAVIADHEAPTFREFTLDAHAVAAEVERFHRAVALSRHQLEKLRDRAVTLQGEAGEQVGYVLEAHLAMLSQSRLIRGVVHRIEGDAVNAEAALDREIESIAESFSFIDDVYLAARLDDVRVVGARLLRNLTQTPFASLTNLETGSILLGTELTPADMALIDKSRVAAFATETGGAESHTAILARALGIPAVIGCNGLIDAAEEGAVVLVDGFSGTVTINPTADTVATYEARCIVVAHERRELALVRNLPPETRDGVKITLEANVNLELVGEIEQAVEMGAEGIGLVRTEFLFMNREDLPEEDEQTAALTRVVLAMNGSPVTIRTLDIGGDKLAFSMRDLEGDSANPALGLRAIRLSLKYRALLDTQFAAILRAAHHGPVRILLPMISSLSEVIQAREILNEVYNELKLRRVPVAETLPPLGIMIEVPGAALTADAFSMEAAFFAIGTNDLTQYTLAIDRGDEQVAYLYNTLHPAVLRLIQFTTDAAARANIPVSVCGEIAGDPRYTPLLLGLGLRTLSMAPASLLRVKQRLRRLTINSCQRLAADIIETRDPVRIAAMLDAANTAAFS